MPFRQGSFMDCVGQIMYDLQNHAITAHHYYHSNTIHTEMITQTTFINIIHKHSHSMPITRLNLCYLAASLKNHKVLVQCAN